jgi:GST-like protein
MARPSKPKASLPRSGVIRHATRSEQSFVMSTSKEHLLFGAKNSGSAAAEIALEWAGRPYRVVTAATWEAGSALKELRRANPLQQIPTLVLPNGSVLTESAAILIHLGLAHPKSGLLPKDPSQRAQVIRALVFIAANCYSQISISDYPERWLPKADDAAQKALRAGARAQLHRAWATFADQFHVDPSGQGGLFGAELTAADVLAVVVSKWSGTRQYLARRRPAFAAALKRIEQHPRITPVFARHWDAP